VNWWLTITHRWFVFAFAVMLLGSAIPPPSLATTPKIAAPVKPEPVKPEPFKNEPPVAIPAPPPLPATAESEADPPNWSELYEVRRVEAEAGPLSSTEELLVSDDPSFGGVRVLISIPQQKLYAFKDGKLWGTSPVSTGKKGHRTPTGTFPILQKKVRHFSNLYDNAPMPYMQRLTHGGVALHAGSLPGYPASHGCIRLPRSFAKKLYDLTRHGTPVTVTSQKPKSAEQALSLT
jgi:lipoprotein-anchoring transpeptidase ErfK/SrfK